jgi:sulfur carrier protein
VISVNGDPVDGVSKTIIEILAMLSIDTRGIAVARNGDVVPRSSWSDVALDEGDRIEIVTAAAGG